MTIEEIKEKYGHPEDGKGHTRGYVYCHNCPLNHESPDEVQSKYCPEFTTPYRSCDGMGVAWEAIEKYLKDPEAVLLNETYRKEKGIGKLLCDINPAEIASQIERDYLGQWCETIRTEILKKVREPK